MGELLTTDTDSNEVTISANWSPLIDVLSNFLTSTPSTVRIRFTTCAACKEAVKCEKLVNC